jgi:D-serine deaminase-like pyridoxal phosphate-dependent protein
LAITVDSMEGVQRLATAMTGCAAVIDVFVEIDVGHGRCGLPPGKAAVALAQAIDRYGSMCFAGLQAYQGRAQHVRSVQERQEAIARAVNDIQLTRKFLEVAGFPVPLVTGAGTGTFALEAASGVFGELQAGSFMFMDADYAQNDPDPGQPAFEHALFIKTQVMSTGSDHAVCDAGHKSHAIDSGMPRVHALHPGQMLQYFNGGDEHGLLRPTGANTRLPALGEVLWLIPGHCDPTVNLHDVMIGVRGGLERGVTPPKTGNDLFEA